MDVVGDHIAVVPQRDAMYVAGSEDDVSLRIMFELTEKTIADEPRPLCPLPMKLEDGEWVDWAPPKNHALRDKFDDLELHFLGGHYADQKELLDRSFEGNDDAPFVASFSAMRNEETQKLRSFCVWSPVDSLLPRTQLVMFAGGEGMVASGEWEHVVSIVGHLMVPDENYYPTRFRVTEFPNEEQLAEIGMI